MGTGIEIKDEGLINKELGATGEIVGAGKDDLYGLEVVDCQNAYVDGIIVGIYRATKTVRRTEKNRKTAGEPRAACSAFSSAMTSVSPAMPCLAATQATL